MRIIIMQQVDQPIQAFRIQKSGVAHATVARGEEFNPPTAATAAGVPRPHFVNEGCPRIFSCVYFPEYKGSLSKVLCITVNRRNQGY